jgi:hypothetical protein
VLAVLQPLHSRPVASTGSAVSRSASGVVYGQWGAGAFCTQISPSSRIPTDAGAQIGRSGARGGRSVNTRQYAPNNVVFIARQCDLDAEPALIGRANVDHASGFER